MRNASPAPRTSRGRTPSARRAAALAHIANVERTCDRTSALGRDPVRFARAFDDPRDRELAAMLAALMAFGRVETIGAKLGVLFARLGPSPARAAVERSEEDLVASLRTFRHRTFRGEDIARLIAAAGVLIRRDGRLYAALERAFERHGTLREALGEYVDELRALAWPTGMPRPARHLLPDPRGPSACKRLVLLSRWLARPDDGVDLGLCALPTRALVIPLDVHVHRVARELGLTERAVASWQAAEEVTEALRALDPEDPVRFDFAVCHTEIARVRMG
jgi:uncharacterized protein (TIGR02757 family)